MRLTAGPYAAVLTSRGATLQALTHAGRDLVVRAGADDPPGTFRGVVVAPWPNRVRDGRYTFAGTEHQLPLNEPERGSALHGFSFDRSWGVGGVSATRVTMWLDLPPQPGYPFTLRLRATYVLSADGLRIELRAANTGTEPAPYGCTIHPYLSCGTPRVDDAVLTLPAATRVEVDERLLPIGTAPVADVDCDFRRGDRVGDRRIDHAFTDLTPEPDGQYDGQYAATLTRSGGWRGAGDVGRVGAVGPGAHRRPPGAGPRPGGSRAGADELCPRRVPLRCGAGGARAGCRAPGLVDDRGVLTGTMAPTHRRREEER